MSSQFSSIRVSKTNEERRTNKKEEIVKEKEE
jgi:hypothetical protein